MPWWGGLIALTALYAGEMGGLILVCAPHHASRREKFYQRQQQQKQREIELTTRRLFFSPSLELQERNMRSRQERAGAVRRLVSLESGARARGDLHTGTRPEAHKEQDSCNNNKRNAKAEGGDFTLAEPHSRPST